LQAQWKPSWLDAWQNAFQNMLHLSCGPTHPKIEAKKAKVASWRMTILLQCRNAHRQKVTPLDL
jgi:hypothetical protein